MDSPCIKQNVCKVLKIFQYGKYLVAYVLNLNFLYKYWRSQKIVYQQISMTRYILTAGDQLNPSKVGAIPGQIILVKQVNIHMFSTEVRYLSVTHAYS